MTREIMFRLWDKEENKMIIPKGFEPKYVLQLNGTIGLFDDGIKMYSSKHLRFEPMQFTGFKDHFGVDIYEGDIVLVENEDDVITECKFTNGGFGLEDLAGGNWARQLIHQPERLTVVGNIYENADLLKEK